MAVHYQLKYVPCSLLFGRARWQRGTREGERETEAGDTFQVHTHSPFSLADSRFFLRAVSMGDSMLPGLLCQFVQ